MMCHIQVTFIMIKLQLLLLVSTHQIYLKGTAHGLAGILQVLLAFPDYLKENQDVENDIKETVDYILKLQKPNYNFPIYLGEKDEQKELIHWCHGAAGMFIRNVLFFFIIK